MAQRRMINVKISLSEQVDNLSNWAQLLYTWSIPHADDIGLLPREPKFLKAKVFPLKDDLKTEEMTVLIGEILSQGLYIEVEISGKKFLRIGNFNLYQTLKRDRNPDVICEYDKVAKTTSNTQKDVYRLNWEGVEALETFWKPNGNQLGAEGKRREEKGREESTPTTPPPKEVKRKKVQKHKFGSFKNVFLTEEEKNKLIGKFGKKKAKQMVENLSEYMATYKGGNKYKSHYLVILKWERDDKDNSKYGKSAPLPAQISDRERKQLKQAQYDEEAKNRAEATKNNDRLREIEEQKKKLLSKNK